MSSPLSLSLRVFLIDEGRHGHRRMRNSMISSDEEPWADSPDPREEMTPITRTTVEVGPLRQSLISSKFWQRCGPKSECACSEFWLTFMLLGAVESRLALLKSCKGAILGLVKGNEVETRGRGGGWLSPGLFLRPTRSTAPPLSLSLPLRLISAHFGSFRSSYTARETPTADSGSQKTNRTGPKFREFQLYNRSLQNWREKFQDRWRGT